MIKLNGYTVIIRKIKDDKETEKLIPIYIDKKDVKIFSKDNPLINFAIKKLK